MTNEEAKKAFEELKAQGETEESILGVLYEMFKDDKISLEELERLGGVLGYEFSEEFKAMSMEDKKTKGYKETEEAEEGVTKEEINDAKEITKEETEESKEKDLEEGSEKPEEKEDSEEEARAKKLFGFDK